MILPQLLITRVFYREECKGLLRTLYPQEYDVRLSVTVWAEYEALFNQKVFTYLGERMDAARDSFMMRWDSSLTWVDERIELPSSKVIRQNATEYFPACFHLYFKNKEDSLLFIMKHGVSHIPA